MILLTSCSGNHTFPETGSPRASPYELRTAACECMYDIIAIIPGGRPTWAPLRFQPFAGEGDGCRAGHVDVAVLFVVFDVQRAQVELDVDAAAGEAVQ